MLMNPLQSKKAGRPEAWDKAVTAAYLFILSMPQIQIAAEVGVSSNTIYGWKKSDWWPKAQEEARAKLFTELGHKAVAGLLRALDDPDKYFDASKFIADRSIPELQKNNTLQISGKVEVEDTESARAKVLEMLNGIEDRRLKSAEDAKPVEGEELQAERLPEPEPEPVEESSEPKEQGELF